MRAREDGESRALEGSLGRGFCRGVGELHTTSFGSGVMSREKGMQRLGGPRIRDACVLRLGGNRRDCGSAERRKGGSEGREVRRLRERVTTIMIRDESIP